MHYDDIRSQRAQKKESVETQEHYAYGIEPINYMESRFSAEEYRGYLTGNIIKYVSRYTRKNGLEDLKKARVYLNWLIDQYSKTGE